MPAYRFPRTGTFALLTLALLAACSESGESFKTWISDSRVATRDIEAEIVATAYSTFETEVWAQLRDMKIVTEDVYVGIYTDKLRAASIQDLSGIDQRHDLFDNSRELTNDIKIMRPQGLYSAEQYAALFQGDYTGTTFTIAFARGRDQISAPRSRATIPDGFALQSPVNGASYAPRADDITLTWSPAGAQDDMFMKMELRCADGNLYKSTIDISGDPGVYTVTPAAFAVMFPDFSVQCTAYVRLIRSRAGALDPAYGGGVVSGRQERRLQLTVTP